MRTKKPSVVVAPWSTLEADCLALTLESLHLTPVAAPLHSSVAIVIALPRGQRFTAQDLAKQTQPWKLPTLLLVDAVEPWTIALGRAVSATAVVSWDSPQPTFAQAIRSLVEGRPTPHLGGPVVDDPFVELTEREREVIALVALGDHDDEIADRLRISPHTARAHVQHSLTKLDVTNRHAAAALARGSGIMRSRLQDLRALGVEARTGA
ncbi:helix-turn-helix transcriptional regulator [Nocardioides mesophilus]|uniref:Response regulator transcription factor n=1 Tax=Nocardioides mesophilus TaxID=433659 RepID=A0A7G9R989_9ACTN|nr:LuxR C-terminal-related transcriptional regulator [Nocardioides mesophilus]QNN52164.1 response regulator transcription factor [Nocardioides mesophilus]